MVKGDIRIVDSYVEKGDPWRKEWIIYKVRPSYSAVIIPFVVKNSDFTGKYLHIWDKTLITDKGFEFMGLGHCIGLVLDYVGNVTRVYSKSPPEGYYVIGVTEECKYDAWIPPEGTYHYVIFFPIKEGHKPAMLRFEAKGVDITVSLMDKLS